MLFDELIADRIKQVMEACQFLKSGTGISAFRQRVSGENEAWYH